MLRKWENAVHNNVRIASERRSRGFRIVSKRFVVKCLLVAVGGVVLARLGFWLTMSQSTADFHNSTISESLPRGEIIYSHSDSGDLHGLWDDTVIEKIADCSRASCRLKGHAVLKGCANTSANCIAPWTSISKMPPGLIIAPLGGYPKPVFTPASRLLTDPATLCTASMSGGDEHGNFSHSKLICVSRAEHTLLFRSTTF